MAKGSKNIQAKNSAAELVDEKQLFKRVSTIIEKRKHRAGSFVNREVIIMYWEIWQHIGSVLLGRERAEYGKRIVSALATQLMILCLIYFFIIGS